MKKFFKVLLHIFIWIFAIVGLGLTVGYIAIVNRWTNEKGSIDFNNRKFQEVAQNDSQKRDSTGKLLFRASEVAQIAYKLMVIEKYFPENAKQIIQEWEKTGDAEYINKMIQAVNIKAGDSVNLESEFNKNNEIFSTNFNFDNTNVFDWIAQPEWTTMKGAIVRDKSVIDSAAKVLGIEPRLLVTVLIGEQIRLRSTNRETVKQLLSPLRSLVVESQYSLGVTGIKETTAQQVEHNLKDSASPYYLGPKYQNLISFTSGNISEERTANLVNYRNHYYSYLYAGLIVKQVREQWKRAGYDISLRPEILTTLFNIGFRNSQPNASPEVGGANIKIAGKNYTFGGIGYEFYYSGELTKEFPYEKVKWEEIINKPTKLY